MSRPREEELARESRRLLLYALERRDFTEAENIINRYDLQSLDEFSPPSSSILYNAIQSHAPLHIIELLINKGAATYDEQDDMFNTINRAIYVYRDEDSGDEIVTKLIDSGGIAYNKARSSLSSLSLALKYNYSDAVIMNLFAKAGCTLDSLNPDATNEQKSRANELESRPRRQQYESKANAATTLSQKPDLNDDIIRQITGYISGPPEAVQKGIDTHAAIRAQRDRSGAAGGGSEYQGAGTTAGSGDDDRQNSSLSNITLENVERLSRCFNRGSRQQDISTISSEQEHAPSTAPLPTSSRAAEDNGRDGGMSRGSN